MHRNRLPIRVLGIALASLLPALGLACAQETGTSASPAKPATDVIGYRFDAPDRAYRLPKRLDEISGLTLLADGRLGAVQDEDGELFVLHAETGEVEGERKFGKDGDYEGVEAVGGALYVLRSDGALFEMADVRADDLDAEEHELDLPQGCDAEGLAYDEAGGRLLVACKERAGKGLSGKKAVYAFDLAGRTSVEGPVLVIDAEAVGAQARGGEDAVSRGMRRLFGAAFDFSSFKPSGLALHPKTGRLYVLSTRPAALVRLEPDGLLVDVHPLPDLLEQPEGIAFLPNGDLFIASEAAGDRAWLLRFEWQGGGSGEEGDG